MAFDFLKKLDPRRADPGTLVDPQGQKLPGYLNTSAGAGRPTLIVLHDAYGVTPQHRLLVNRLVAEGYITFIPDFYRGKVATDTASADQLNQSLAWTTVEREIHGAVAALQTRDAKTRIGLIGAAMGGALALKAAASNPLVAAVVTYYGIPKGFSVRGTKARVQGHFGMRDTRCIPARVEDFEEELRQAANPPEVHWYNAGNGFFHRADSPSHSASDAATAWSRTLQFLRATLG